MNAQQAQQVLEERKASFDFNGQTYFASYDHKGEIFESGPVSADSEKMAVVMAAQQILNYEKAEAAQHALELTHFDVLKTRRHLARRVMFENL